MRLGSSHGNVLRKHKLGMYTVQEEVEEEEEDDEKDRRGRRRRRMKGMRGGEEEKKGEGEIVLSSLFSAKGICCHLPHDTWTIQTMTASTFCYSLDHL